MYYIVLSHLQTQSLEADHTHPEGYVITTEVGFGPLTGSFH